MAQRTRLLTEEQLLEIVPMPSRVLKELRFQRKIPFYSPSYRIRLYDLDAVLAALDGFQVLAARPIKAKRKSATATRN
jgi:hypothetical protein